jgi:hypothetical protein
LALAKKDRLTARPKSCCVLTDFTPKWGLPWAVKSARFE